MKIFWRQCTYNYERGRLHSGITYPVSTLHKMMKGRGRGIIEFMIFVLKILYDEHYGWIGCSYLPYHKAVYKALLVMKLPLKTMQTGIYLKTTLINRVMGWAGVGSHTSK